jgi:hypothetical protein
MSRSERWYTAGIGALLLGLLVTILITTEGRNDLDIFCEASQALLQGQDPYVLKYNEWYSYFYSPFFALVIAPLLPLSAAAAKVVWGLLGMAMLLRSARLVQLLAGPERLAMLREPRTWFFILLVLFQPIRDNFNSAQVTLLVVWASLEGLHRLRTGQWIWGALILGMAIDMKLIPIVLLPYLVYRGRWPHALAVLAAAVLLTFAPALVLGWERHVDLLASRQALIDPTDVRHVLDEEEPSFIALGSLLSAYLSTEGGNTHTLSLPRTLMALDVGTIAVLLLLGRLLLAGLTLYFLRWPPFRPAPSGDHILWETSYLLLCTILIFPHQRNYSMFLAAPAVLWLVSGTLLRLRGAGIGKAWLIGCALAYLGFNTELLVGEFAPIYAHYKVKSFIVLLLIGMLMWLSPERSVPSGPASRS